MNTDNLIVSICVITYGHEKYIAQTIDGILMQEVDFDYELIISNDCSPDSTDEVVESYIKDHPKGNKIKYFSHKKNIGAYNNFVFSVQNAKGKYIALCEGDDYWIDSLKLQRQVDFLEANTDFSMCFTDYLVLSENTNTLTYPNLSKKFGVKSSFTKYDIILNNFIPTLTVMFKKETEVLKYLNENFFPSDWFLHVLNSKYGKIKFLNMESAVYRIHDGGVCSSVSPLLNNQKYLKSIDLFRKQFKNDHMLNFLFIITKAKISFESLKIRLKLILN